jgi:hypothetical protein
MKTLTALGLATIAAMVLTALAGTGIAQAILYTDAAKTIPYAAGTVVDLSLKSGTTTKLTNGSGGTEATCTESTAKGKVANEPGEPVVVIETLTWGGCNHTTDTIATGKLEIKWTLGTSGEVIGQEARWTVFTGNGVTCTYGFGEGAKLGTISGGEAPVLKIEAAVKKTAGGFLCKETAFLDAEYVFTEPHAIYVGSSTTTSLYTDAAKTIPYSAGTVVDLSLKSGTTTKLTNSSGGVEATCTESTAKGKTASETGEVISTNLETLTWGGCAQTTDTLAKGSLEIKWTSGTSGEVIGRETQWTANLFGVSCTYGFGEGTKLGTIAGGEAPVLKIEAAVKKLAGNFLCPEKPTLDAEYGFTEPHALYVGS